MTIDLLTPEQRALVVGRGGLKLAVLPLTEGELVPLWLMT